ncbi:MAG TPA: zf-HC2 domain-containing protein [Solirubrobacteraceae bacterium]|nr:zf-HC2 domain-containing protein [Solirubrobacteraceae bacterium]
MDDGNGDATRSTAAEELILRTVAAHADSLLRTARRHSICLDDAQDAYQHAIEIFMREAHRLDAARAPGWLHVVVKREAQALRKERQKFLISEPIDLDGHEATDLPTPEERLLRFDMVSRSAEALKRLKPQELRALWLRAQGHSYCEIGAMTGWSYTKINRCLAEGRRNFLERYERIEAGDECERWMPVISRMVDGEASPEQILELRPHLRNCPGCRATLRALQDSSRPLAAVFPVPLLAVAADGGDQVSGVLMRLYEAISGGLHERAVHSVTKAQVVLEMAAAGKVTAVAASAAAVAGGGYATVEQVIERPPAVRRVAQTRAHHAQRAPRRPAPVTPTVAPARVVPAPAPASASPARPPDVPDAPRPQQTGSAAAFSATQVDAGAGASAAFDGQARDEDVDYSTREPSSPAAHAARAPSEAATPPPPPASGHDTTSRSSSSGATAAFATAEQQAGFAP